MDRGVDPVPELPVRAVVDRIEPGAIGQFDEPLASQTVGFQDKPSAPQS